MHVTFFTKVFNLKYNLTHMTLNNLKRILSINKQISFVLFFVIIKWYFNLIKFFKLC